MKAGGLITAALLLAGAGPRMAAANPEAPVYHSPTALAIDRAGARLYAADKTASQIVEIDLRSGKASHNIPLPGHPTGLALNRAEDRLYVTAESPADSVYIVNLKDRRVEAVLPAGHDPTAPVLSADGSLLYVCNRFDNDVSVIDLKEKRELKRAPVVRQPAAAALTADGKWLVVGNAEPAGSATDPNVASSVSLIDTQRGEVAVNIRLPNGGVSIRGVAVSPDNRYAFVSHVLAHNRVPTTQLEEGWLTNGAVTVIDLDKRSRLSTFLLDQTHRGAGNPWGLAVSEDGRKLCVNLAGVHEMAVIELPRLLEALEASRAGASGAASSPVVQVGYRPGGGPPDMDMTFLQPYLKRVHLQGRAPRAVLIRGGRAFAGMYFTGSVESVDLDTSVAAADVLRLGSQPLESPARRGERLFHDATVSFQGWLSCSTCHPEGRSDGLNWDLTNDGIGNSKNTKSLLFSDRTPPVTWTGLFPTLDDCVPFEIRTILFASRPKEDAVAIASFLKSLTPAPSPLLKNGGLSEAAQRGELAFQKAGCPECHQGVYLTAMKKRTVVAPLPGDRDRAFDIPSLREVWRTSPYLHDGRASTVREIFLKFDSGNLHGKHEKLSELEIDDLIQYVLSQ